MSRLSTSVWLSFLVIVRFALLCTRALYVLLLRGDVEGGETLKEIETSGPRFDCLRFLSLTFCVLLWILLRGLLPCSTPTPTVRVSSVMTSLGLSGTTCVTWGCVSSFEVISREQSCVFRLLMASLRSIKFRSLILVWSWALTTSDRFSFVMQQLTSAFVFVNGVDVSISAKLLGLVRKLLVWQCERLMFAFFSPPFCLLSFLPIFKFKPSQRSMQLLLRLWWGTVPAMAFIGNAASDAAPATFMFIVSPSKTWR